jgi:3-carboxy-cis,cis-muconate cycloisomerase
MSFSPLDSTLLGPLFADAEMREVFGDEALLEAMLRTEVALARAQAGLGLVPAELGPAIADIHVADLALDALGRETAVAGVPTIPFIKAVRSRLPENLREAFHFGTTTQDIIDTALVLQVERALRLVEADLVAIITGLAVLARAHRTTPCIGRTYGQHAAPISFGFKVAVWMTGIADAADRLPALRRHVLVASLGGPVGTLAAFGARGPQLSEAFARGLGLGAAPIAWHALRGRVTDLGAWLTGLIGALAKMATDVAQLASTEVAEVAEPHAPGRGGSSSMPHKRNPVSATIILAAQAAAKGHLVTLFDAMAAAHERPVGLWHAEWLALPPLFGLASGALREVRGLATGLVVDAERMRENIGATRGLVFADAALQRLSEGMGREAASAKVEQAADEVRRTGRHLRNVLVAGGCNAAVLDDAFAIEGAVEAAAGWTDRAVDSATETLTRLREGPDRCR